MAEHMWTALCTRSIIDKDSNNISLMEILEKLSFVVEARDDASENEIPIVPINIHLVSSWARSDPSTPEIRHGRIILESPSAEPLYQTDFDINLTDYLRQRIRTIMHSLPIPENGWYKFHTEIQTEDGDWVRIKSLPLEVGVDFKDTSPSE